MISILLYIVLGYLSGSILFARIAAGLFHKNTILTESADANPGTSNAFVYGGFWCGIFTLSGDLLKGFLPVYLFLHTQHASALPFSFILAAPVLGHAFPIFYQIQRRQRNRRQFRLSARTIARTSASCHTDLLFFVFYTDF